MHRVKVPSIAGQLECEPRSTVGIHQLKIAEIQKGGTQLIEKS